MPVAPPVEQAKAVNAEKSASVADGAAVNATRPAEISTTAGTHAATAKSGASTSGVATAMAGAPSAEAAIAMLDDGEMPATMAAYKWPASGGPVSRVGSYRYGMERGARMHKHKHMYSRVGCV
jgi:hypothetical protein